MAQRFAVGGARNSLGQATVAPPLVPELGVDSRRLPGRARRGLQFGEAAQVHDARPDNKRFTVCFLGRVCPIKDVITFINAMRLVADRVPDVSVHIMEDQAPPRYPARVILHPALRPDPLFRCDCSFNPDNRYG